MSGAFARGDAMRIAMLYLPIALALLAGLLSPRHPRRFAACLLSFLWTLSTLVVLQHLNQHFAWWSFAPSVASLRGMPVEAWLGWAILWGLLPQLAFPRWPVPLVAAAMLGADLIAMPLCAPLVVLGHGWIAGEAVALALVLLPALCIARWTQAGTQLRGRAAMQLALSALLFLFLLPELAFRLKPGPGWGSLLSLHGTARQLAFALVLLLALPGVGAVVEFATRGGGTPIPYDPPVRLVRSGIFRYVANPMQLSCALVMLLWALLLQNVWLGLAAAISVVYSAGLAAWDEHCDLEQRFGAEWTLYRAEVRDWFPRVLPFHAGLDALVYMADTCGPCSELRTWIAAREPAGVMLLAAETLPAGSIRRMRYDPRDGSAPVDGVRAFGRVLEHIHLGWALAGLALRLPGIWHVAQLCMDASGFGPRTLAAVPGREPAG